MLFRSDGFLGYMDRYMVLQSEAAMLHYDWLLAQGPLAWFSSHYHFGPPVQAHRTSLGMTSFQDKEYLPQMWDQHRWKHNRPDMSVWPSDFRANMPVEGAPHLRRPVLVCHQPYNAQQLDFEVYDMPSIPLAQGGYGSISAVYLTGLPSDVGFPVPGSSCNAPYVWMPMQFVVLSNVQFGNEFGYAKFSISLPQPGYNVIWAMQVVSAGYSGPPCTTSGDSYYVASNSWRFRW